MKNQLDSIKIIFFIIISEWGMYGQTHEYKILALF